MTKAEFAADFQAYFEDLRAENERDGARVSRRDEWARFVEHAIDGGKLPPDAVSWTCPRR
jgi:hypothetical protein